MPTDFWGNAIFSLVPTVLFGLVFWFILRAIIRSDRNERASYAKVEAEERAKLAADRRLLRRYSRGLSRTFGSSGAGSGRPS